MYKGSEAPIVTCIHCGQWCVAYTQCKHCGAPVIPDPFDENDSPLVLCNYCNQFGIPQEECSHCGAPMPEKVMHIIGPYWADGGVSWRERNDAFYNAWAYGKL